MTHDVNEEGKITQEVNETGKSIRSGIVSKEMTWEDDGEDKLTCSRIIDGNQFAVEMSLRR